MNTMSKVIRKSIPTHTTGIYKITNTKTNQHYIGLSSNCRERLLRHTLLLRQNQHGNKHLQNSFNKYGKEHFTYSLLEKCKKSQLFKKEIYYTKKYNSMTPNGFNICKPGKNRREGIYEGFVNSSKCKPFEVISPDEKIYTVNVCSTFAKEHPITASQLRCLKRGDYTHSKNGWRLKETPKDRATKITQNFYVRDSNNISYHVKNLKDFETRYNIPKETLSYLKRKRFEQHNGWSIDWSKTDASKFKCKIWNKNKQNKYWKSYFKTHYKNKKLQTNP